MSWGFEPGRIYNRRADIHARFGGQQQGGIITPVDRALVIIITGEEGLAHGYEDRMRDDGVFEYFGEGQVGNMTLERGNRAIAEHSHSGKSLLLFRKTKQGLRFLDEMVYDRHHIERGLDRNGNERDAIVFELRPLEGIVEFLEDQRSDSDLSLEDLRKRALIAANAFSSDSKKTTRNVYERSRDIRDYVLARSQGCCEGCHAAAPFRRVNKSPYLEPHHILRRSDGGPDHPSLVIALCPTCHRRVHFGEDGTHYNDALLGRMGEIEPNT